MDMYEFTQWAKKELERISQEAMQKRQRMETVLNQMNLELGEANGQMRLLEQLIQQAETNTLPGQTKDNDHDRELSYPATGPMDTH